MRAHSRVGRVGSGYVRGYAIINGRARTMRSGRVFQLQAFDDAIAGVTYAARCYLSLLRVPRTHFEFH